MMDPLKNAVDIINKENVSKAIADKNDDFRVAACFIGFGITITKNLNDRFPEIGRLLVKVGEFDSFSEDNDPYREHDFGSLEYEGEKIFWKIDYYDQKVEHWTDPLDPKCRRILTLMLAEDY